MRMTRISGAALVASLFVPLSLAHAAEVTRLPSNNMFASAVSNDEAKETFGEWEEPKPYIRIVPQPQDS